jgi:hypothetical protein
MKCLNLVFIAVVLTPGVSMGSAAPQSLSPSPQPGAGRMAYGIDMYLQEEL